LLVFPDDLEQVFSAFILQTVLKECFDQPGADPIPFPAILVTPGAGHEVVGKKTIRVRWDQGKRDRSQPVLHPSPGQYL